MHAEEYVAESGLYYLGSRYYDPETGRFLNADALLGANGDLISYNLFTYCSNNPVNYYDPFGCSARHASRLARNKIMKAATGSTNAEVYRTRNNTPSVTIDDFKNSNTNYSLYDSKRHDPDGVYHEQILSGSLEYGIDPQAVLGAGVSLTAISGRWEWDNFELGLMNFGKAEAYVGKGKGFKGGGAIVSLWSPDITFTIFDLSITIGANVGSIGAEVDLSNGFKASYANGFGFTFSVTPK